MSNLYIGTTTQKKRVLRFIKYLNRINRKYFSLNHVCRTSHRGKAKLQSCGTVACAIGHLPDFNPKRFSLSGYTNSIYYDVVDKVTGYRLYLNIAEDYLGFTYKQATDIFSPGSYSYKSKNPTPKMVAALMQRVLDSKELPFYAE